MKATVFNQAGEEIKELELDSKIFGIVVKPEVVQQAVVAQQANSRPVLAHAKGRAEVSGGGKKPWRQKGTGRARHGSIRSPLWRGGGVTFGPTKERNFGLKINKKVKKKAILMGLSDKAGEGRIILLDKIELAEGKTKKVFEILQNLKLREKKAGKRTAQAAKKVDDKKEKKAGKKVKSILLVVAAKDENLKRASRNIARLELIDANSLNIVDLLKSQYLLMTVDSIDKIEKTFVK